MTNVIFNNGFIGFLIWVLLFAVSTAALAIAIHCMWVLHKTIFATAEFKEKLIPFLFLAFALMVSLLPLRVQAALPKELPTAPTKFLTGACLTRTEDLWITAEAGGVYRLSGQEMKPKWEDMRKQPGFPKTDNCTAVCEDSLGRIWVGTSNMGVQVFHKRQWKRYDRDTVLGGSHVHALASTSTGLTAVAHEQGVSLYNSHDDSWRDFTVLNGLPAGGVRAICFGNGDSLHCAMENGGYVRIDVRGTGRSAQRLSAPDTWGKNRAVFYPLTTAGQGLCSNLCNGVSVGSLGQVCIASLNGISYSTTGGFRYLQGSDLKAKPKWEDMRKLPGVFFEKNRNSCRFYEKETFFIYGLFFIHTIRKDLS